MEVKKTSENPIDDGKDVDLPGFRFHPTDEELVGFYLRRKVKKKLLRRELIEEADIYKFDPWDLPKSSIKTGDMEWYFFCKRGRKYKNSIRPNRVTCSGFWKATGIDRSIYSSSGDIIGLKKTLVYYRGSAGKGTKTEWMMHEFRLPPDQTDENSIAQDAEVWTLCRILKRNSSHGRSRVPSPSSNPRINPPSDRSSPETTSIGSDDRSTNLMKAIPTSYNAPMLDNFVGNEMVWDSSTIIPNPQDMSMPIPSSFIYNNVGDLSKYEDWEDLQSIVNHASSPNFYH